MKYIENWYILCVAIVKKTTVEQAFQIYNTGKGKTTLITEADVIDMIQFKSNGLTYKEVGKIYSISKDSVYRRIRRYNSKSDKNLN